MGIKIHDTFKHIATVANIATPHAMVVLSKCMHMLTVVATINPGACQ